MITEEEINQDGISGGQTIIEKGDKDDFSPYIESSTDEDDSPPKGDDPQPKIKFYVTEGEIRIAAEAIQIIDPVTGKLITVQLSQYAKEKIETMFPSANELKSNWNNLDERKLIIEKLDKFGISIDQLMEFTNQKEADPFDLLCFVSYNLKPKTRKQRSELLQKNKPEFFSNYSEKAQIVLKLILEKYVDFGLNQIRPDIISVEPFTLQGNTIEIVNEFGGFKKYKNAIEQLQKLLYIEAA